MPIGSDKAKKFAAVSLLALGCGAYSAIRADTTKCNSNYQGRCSQWCSDWSHGSNSTCIVTQQDKAVCVCSDGSTHVL